MTQKMLRGNVTIYAFAPEAFADSATPDLAELNGDLGWNISCAIADDYTLNQAESDTDDSRSICDIGSVATPTFYNYEASLDGFRDADPDADGLYNLFRDLFRAPDVPYILVKRIGGINTKPFEADDIISMYEVNTDYPVDVVEDGSSIMFGARFKPTGNLNLNYSVTA